MRRAPVPDDRAFERVRLVILFGSVALMAGGLVLIGGAGAVGAALAGAGALTVGAGSVLWFVLLERQRREGRGGYLPRRLEPLFWLCVASTTAWLGTLAYLSATRVVSYGAQDVPEPAWGTVVCIGLLWAVFAALALLFKRRTMRPAGSPIDLRIFVRGLAPAVAAAWGKRTVGGAPPEVEEAVEGTAFTEVYFPDAGPWASDASLARHAARELGREVLFSTSGDVDDQYARVQPSGAEHAAVWADGEPPRLASGDPL